MQLDFEIGGESIRIMESQDRPALLWPYWPFDLFQKPIPGSPDIQAEVHVVKKLPALSFGKLIFDSNQGLWKLYESSEGYALERLHTQTHGPHTVALISPDYSRVAAWFLECPDPLGGPQSGWIPAEIMNPIIEICLLTRMARCGGILLHASGIKTDGKTYVFSGPSGAGKSTIAELFKENLPGAVILSDEKMILRRHSASLTAYGTPWYGSSHCAVNDSAPLAHFFLISHGQGRHEVRSLSGVAWNCRVLREGTFPHWDRQGMEETTLFLSELMRHSDRRELAFLKEPSVADFVMRSSIAAAP